MSVVTGFTIEPANFGSADKAEEMLQNWCECITNLAGLAVSIILNLLGNSHWVEVARLHTQYVLVSSSLPRRLCPSKDPPTWTAT
jgi:hypothetical protein